MGAESLPPFGTEPRSVRLWFTLVLVPGGVSMVAGFGGWGVFAMGCVGSIVAGKAAIRGSSAGEFSTSESDAIDGLEIGAGLSADASERDTVVAAGRRGLILTNRGARDVG